MNLVTLQALSQHQSDQLEIPFNINVTGDFVQNECKEFEWQDGFNVMKNVKNVNELLPRTNSNFNFNAQI